MNAKKAKALRRQARAETDGGRDRALRYNALPGTQRPHAGSAIQSGDTTRARYRELKRGQEEVNHG